MRKLTKYAILIISVLSASLLNEFIQKSINQLYRKPDYLSVLIGFVITIAVFVPMVSVVGKWIHKASVGYVKISKRVAHSKTFGLVFGFLVIFLVLFVLSARMRHNLNVFDDLKKLLDLYSGLFK